MEEDKKFKKGICRNFGTCDKADTQELQEIEEGHSFECTECHSPLTEVDDKGNPVGMKKQGMNPKKRNKIIAIVCGVVVIGLIIAAIIVFAPRFSSFKAEEAPVEEVPVDTMAVEEAHAIEEDTVQLPEEPEVVEEAPAPEAPKAPAPSAPAVHKLSYGSWTGGWKNGQPNGTGTLTYTETHVIDSRDSKQRVAQPGEYVVGEWDNGHLVQGRWFKKDGSKEAIIIGKAG